MIKAGVIGHPISHSRSPRIHGYWLGKFAIDGEYKAYDIAPDDLVDGFKRLIDQGLVGLNVTIPHKQHIMNLCHSLSDEAQKIGAVNTITISSDQRIHGHNTDAFGFAQNLIETIPEFDWANTIATVIGAGGAARAVLYALSQYGIPEIRIINRTIEHATELGLLYQAKAIEWDHRHHACATAQLVINTTSLGMKGQPDLDIDLSGISEDAIVYDIVYHPLHTPLLQQASQRKLRIVTGIGMLLHQARPGFQSWFGIYPDVPPELKEMILRD